MLSALGVQLMQYALLMKFELEDETGTLEAFIWEDAVSKFILLKSSRIFVLKCSYFSVLYSFASNKINDLGQYHFCTLCNKVVFPSVKEDIKFFLSLILIGEVFPCHCC